MSKSDILHRYHALRAKIARRKQQAEAVCDRLEKDTAWLTSPASTRFHMNHEGGLLELVGAHLKVDKSKLPAE